MKLTQTICLFVTVCFLVAAALPQTKLGSLRIAVMDPNGAVIARAKVRIIPYSGPDQTGTTDELGHFASQLPPGNYDVFISFQDLSPVAKKVRVKAGKSTEYSVKMNFDPLVKLFNVESRAQR